MSSGPPSKPTVWANFREHPIATALLVMFTILATASAPWWTPSDWSLGRQLAAGAVTGLGITFLFVFTHLIGAYDDFRD